MVYSDRWAFRPGVRRYGSETLWLAAVAVFPLVAGWGCSNRAAEKKEVTAVKRPVPVQVARAETQSYRRTVESVGSLFPDEEVTVSSEVEGRVEQVLADVGDRVTLGQPLVRIGTVELSLIFDQARAAVQQVQARLGLPEQGEGLRDVRDAADVKKALADLNDAEQKYQRAKTLLGRALVAREAFDEADARLKSARAAYDLAVQMVENLRAQLVQFRAAADLARKKLDDSTIRAPFAGEIKERTVTVGQYLKVQSPVMVIVSVDPLRARLKVPEKMAGWIKVGQTASVRVEAYSDLVFTGRISRLNPIVDQQTRTYEAEALIANRDGRLKAGFFIKASIPSELVDRVLFVPDQAVQYSYGVYKVFIIEGSTLREKEVRIGERPSRQVEIVNGLSDGERVALPFRGSELRDRAEVEIVP
jgi:multidrug efflux pump subunit AcrA (membrane-fusion protein)